jgi:hypothetical protein
MSTPTATCEVTLPPAAPQHIGHCRRIITISGSAADGSQTVAIDFTGPVVIRAPIGANVAVSVVEVIANGKSSAPCVLNFVPHEQAEAIAADPTAFSVRVVGVDSSPGPDAVAPLASDAIVPPVASTAVATVAPAAPSPAAAAPPSPAAVAAPIPVVMPAAT